MTEREVEWLMAAMPTVGTLDELTELTRQRPDMFIRWRSSGCWPASGGGLRPAVPGIDARC
jgi:hypothetical protein